MANWIGTARTNYFRVKDVAAFKTWAAGAGLGVFERDGRYGLYSEVEHGAWPANVLDAAAIDNDRAFDLVPELNPHVGEGEIVVCIEAGAENIRYITGEAIAFKASAGRPDKITVTLDDIYELAHALWGERPALAEF